MQITTINQNNIDSVYQISLAEFAQESWTHSQFLDAINNNNYLCLCACEDCVYSYCLALNSLDDINILSIATANEHKNKGYAKMLIEYIKNFATSQNKTVSLEVKETNTKALSLYQKMGFKVVSKRANYYKDGTTALIMFFNLN